MITTAIQAGPMRGPDAETVISLTLEDVVFGARKTLDLRMPVECEPCNGSPANTRTSSGGSWPA